MYTCVCVCTCTCTLSPELLLALPLLGAPGACCQQLLHHINEVDAVHDQCLQLQLQHMQLLLAQLKCLQVSVCILWQKRHRDNMAKEKGTRPGCVWVGRVCGWGEGQGCKHTQMGSRLSVLHHYACHWQGLPHACSDQILM